MRFLPLLFLASCAAFSTAVHAQDAPKITFDVTKVGADDVAKVSTFGKEGVEVAQAWFPRIRRVLDIKSSQPYDHITIFFDPSYGGVAETSGTRIRVSTKYILGHLDDLGMIVHELTHAEQFERHGYPRYDPVWLVEGIADYVRFFNYEPIANRPHPRKGNAKARASYRTTAAFLHYVSCHYDVYLVPKLDAALRDGSYKEDLWKRLTGRTLDQLDQEWQASLPA